MLPLVGYVLQEQADGFVMLCLNETRDMTLEPGTLSWCSPWLLTHDAYSLDGGGLNAGELQGERSWLIFTITTQHVYTMRHLSLQYGFVSRRLSTSITMEDPNDETELDTTYWQKTYEKQRRSQSKRKNGLPSLHQQTHLS